MRNVLRFRCFAMEEILLVVVIVSVFLWPSTVVSQFTWTNEPSNPLLSDGFRLLDPCVLYNTTTGQYDIWYSDGYLVKRGGSVDGVTWTLTGASQSLTSLFSAHFASAVEVVKIDGTFYLYCTCEALDRQSVFLGLATSPDGNTWTKHPASPVLLNGGPGTWESRGVGWAKVAVRNGKYYMFYMGAVGDTGSIGLATSTDGVSWQKYSYNPVLDVRAMGYPAVVELFPTGVLFKDPSFHLLFHKVRQPGVSADSVNLATSADGITWTIYGGNPVLAPGASGSWDAGGLGGGSLRYRNGKFRLWYQGHAQVPPGGFLEWKMGGASSTDADPGFWYSLDGPNSGQMNAVAIDHRGDLLAAAFTDGLYRSTNMGASWTKVGPEIFQSLLVGQGGVIFGGSDGSGVMKSTDGGTSWSSANTGLSEQTIPALEIQSGVGLWAGGYQGGIFYSGNNGQSWDVRKASSGSPIYSFAFPDGGFAFAATYGAGILRSTDGGGTWSSVNNGLGNLFVQAITVDATNQLLAGTDAGVFRSSDNGASWTKISDWTSQVHDVIATSGGEIYAGTFAGVYLSTDGGGSWSLTNNGLTNTNVGAATLDPDGHLIVGTWGGGTFRSSRAVSLATIQGEYLVDSSTVGLWHLNEGSAVVSDASGNRNHGATTGTPAVSGRFGRARWFQGPSSFIRVEDSPSLRQGQFTVEAWVYSSEYDGMPWGIVATKERTSSSFSYRLSMAGSTKRVYFATGISQNEGITSSVQLENGRLYHVAGSFDGTNLRVYVNGVLAGSKVQPGTPAYNGDVLYLGRDIDNIGVWKGMIDEVRISSKARIPAEFNLQLPPKSVFATATPSAINLTWLNGGGGIGVLLYRIYRGTDSTNMAQIDSTTGTSYQDTQVSPGISYFYRVGAVDLTGFEGTRSVATYATVPLSNLVAHYPFNGNANDESGNGFNGSVNGATITNDRFGQAGKAYTFDGTNDYIQLPNLPPMGVLSVSAWFYPTYIPPARHAFITALFGRDQHPWVGAGLSTMNDNLVATISFSDLTYSEVQVVPVSLNAWHHAVLVYNGSMGLVYLDNKLVWSALLGKALNVPATPSFIGRDRPSGTEYWFGSIDDVRIYARDLSASEVDSLYRLGGWQVLPQAPNLIYPRNGAGVTASVVPFIWSKASLDATSYWFETATDSLFTYRSVDSTVTDTTKVVTLPAFGRYWWRVKAKNVYGWGPFSTANRLTYGLTAVDDPSLVPTAYELGQNYPNPFNPSTSIRYGLPMRVHVRLAVFNSLGQEIAVLSEGEQEAGYHEVKFDATNLSSGVYLYRLQADNFVQTRKLLLLR